MAVRLLLNMALCGRHFHFLREKDTYDANGNKRAPKDSNSAQVQMYAYP